MKKPETVGDISDEVLDNLADRLVKKMAARSGVIQSRMMDIATTAIYLGRSEPAVRHMILRGTIPSTKLDGKIEVDRHMLDRLIEAKTA